MRRLMLLLALAAPSLANGSTLNVDLKLTPNSVLPGIPAAITFTITNTGRAPVTLPPKLLMMVYPVNGSAFVASWAGTIAGELSEFADVRLAPKQTFAVTLSTNGTLYKPALFSDSRLLEPGRYELQAFLSNSFFGLDDRQKLTEMLRKAVASNRAILVVREPMGDDHDVWQAMLATGDGTWHPAPANIDHVGRIATRLFPKSEYTLWLVASGVGEDEESKAENLRVLLEQAPVGEQTAARLLRIAQWEIAVANKYGQVNPSERRRYTEKARASLAKVLNVAQEGPVRTLANETLEALAEIAP